MSEFIYRDYGTPIIMKHNLAIARKNMWRELAGEVYIEGIRYYYPRIYFRGKQSSTIHPVSGTSGYGLGLTYLSANEKHIRDDNLFKRFMNNLGTPVNVLSKQSYKGTEFVYFYMNPYKLNYSTQTAAYIATKINDEYYSYLGLGSVTHPIYAYEQKQSAGNTVGNLPTTNTLVRYEFNNGGVYSNTSADGYFTITNSGTIVITATGVVNANTVSYDPAISNTRTYTIRRTDNVSGTTTYTSETIYLKVKREYVELKFTIGGEIRNVPILYTQLHSFTPTTTGVQDYLSNIDALADIIESDPTTYLANISSSLYSVDTYDNTTFSMPRQGVTRVTAGCSFDNVYGNVYDLLALYDDGTYYSKDPTMYNKVVKLTEVPSAQYIRTNSNLYTFEITYTRRYQVLGTPIDTSAIVTSIRNASDIMASSFITRKNANRRLSGSIVTNIISSNNVSVDTNLKNLIMSINRVIDTSVFHYVGPTVIVGDVIASGDYYLKADVIDAMTANQFMEFMSVCFETGWKEKDSSNGFFDFLVSIVIVVVAAFVGAFTFIISGGNALLALAAMQAFMGVAQYAYMESTGNMGGLQMIGGVMQIIGLTMTAIAISSGWEAVMKMSGEEMLTVGGAQAVTTEIAGVTTVLSQMGIVDEDIAKYSQITAGTVMLYAELESTIANIMTEHADITSDKLMSAIKNFSLEPLNKTAIKDVSNFIDLLKTSANIYMNINTLGAETQQMATQDQAIPQDGVEAVYVMQDKVYAFDALEQMAQNAKNIYGVFNTDMIISRSTI